MTNGTDKHIPVHSIVPAVNIVETTGSYIVTLDIPGAVKENIKANIENNTLVVSADVADYVQSENAETARRYHREFSLANDIELHSVDARYELGVLTLTLNKKQQYLPKTITIN